ncbi:MAG TPA: alpha-amylase family protein, partial [Candidatus Limnocylindrales bacterium]|nr:alpha-amylase family protein [Candidatus Limnocylindrales bacterium]
RSLGMHRVYNSAFMHMIRDENNAGYRKVIGDTVEFDPAILGRYVNFLTNPDEETAIEQFDTGDKYFGAATLLATMPGLPMIGHGQIEGFTEKYGMEFQRARLDEQPNAGLIEHFEAQIVPLLRERRRFASSADFRLYDVVADGGELLEDVFAYSNGRGGDRSLIVYHNKFGAADGWIRDSIPFAVKAADGSKTMERDTLAAALDLRGGAGSWLRLRDGRSGMEALRSVREIRELGLHVRLDAYGRLVILDIAEVVSTTDAPWEALAAEIGDGWIASLDDALAAVRLRPVHDAVASLLAPGADVAAGWKDVAAAVGIPDAPAPKLRAPEPGASASTDRAVRAAVLLRPLGRARFDELRLADVLRRLGLDDAEIARTRAAIEVPEPDVAADATGADGVVSTRPRRAPATATRAARGPKGPRPPRPRAT